MGAPIGNNFWQIRTKHGRDKIFATPDLLLEAAIEYFQWCDSHPLIEIDFKGKDADRVEIPKMRAYTLHGLCIYLGVNTGYFRDFRDTIKSKSTQLDKDFSSVIAHIEETIYEQKFVGAAAGFLNPNIIARDLGLAEKTESKIDHTLTQALDYSQLSDEALKEIEDASKNQPRLS